MKMKTTMDTEMETSQSSNSKEMHEHLKGRVEEFASATQDGRSISERCRDYKDGKQWTESQIKALKARKQSPIVNNRIKVKHNGLLGLTSSRKGDPKVYPRNEKDSEAAEAATDALRYASDKTKLNPVFLECADNFFCEGYTGAHIVEEQTPRGDVEIIVEHIAWDRIFYDAYSRKPDFSDARDKGFGLWMDEDDILTAFPETDPEQLLELDIQSDETFEDKPRWVEKHGNRKRHFVVTHYFLQKGVWHMAIYSGGGFLLEPIESPYIDEYGRPDCPLEFVHAYIDREGRRYGELESFLDLQDEINHRRSKALYLLSQRQTYGNKGAVQNVAKAKRELAKPDGHLEVGQGEYGKDFGTLPTGDMAQGQFQLLQEAKSEMDAQSYNAQLSGERSVGDLSGVAIQKLQNSGVTELVKLFEHFSAFKLAVYRQMWNRIRQFWTQEKWIRVTDDEDKLRWVGFNVPMTMRDMLQEIMEDEARPQQMRLGASAQMILLEKQNPQALEQMVEVRNRASELDVDIILHESYDSANVSQEQLDAILKFGLQGQFDVVDLLEISNITGKDRLIERLENRRKDTAEAQAANAGKDPQSQYLIAQAEESKADAAKKMKEAEQKAIENQLLQTQQIEPIHINI